jgi:hypothetical protein
MWLCSSSSIKILEVFTNGTTAVLYENVQPPNFFGHHIANFDENSRLLKTSDPNSYIRVAFNTNKCYSSYTKMGFNMEYRLLPAPLLNNISPHVSFLPQQEVHITGKYFLPSTVCKLGGDTILQSQIIDGTNMMCIVNNDVLENGVADVIKDLGVMTTFEIESKVPRTVFLKAPNKIPFHIMQGTFTVVEHTPVTGSSIGGDTITITGTNFSPTAGQFSEILCRWTSGDPDDEGMTSIAYVTSVTSIYCETVSIKTVNGLRQSFHNIGRSVSVSQDGGKTYVQASTPSARLFTFVENCHPNAGTVCSGHGVSNNLENLCTHCLIFRDFYRIGVSKYLLL